MICPQCKTNNAYKTLEQGRYFVTCVYCGLHTLLKLIHQHKI